MGAYQVKQGDAAWSELLERTRAGEEVEIEQDGTVVAKVIPFPHTKPGESGQKRLRPYGQNFSGLAGKDLSWLDAPLDEETQRAFGMID